MSSIDDLIAAKVAASRARLNNMMNKDANELSTERFCSNLLVRILTIVLYKAA